MNVYRLTNWVHREPGAGEFGYRCAFRGEHAVMISIGRIPKDEKLTQEKILKMLEETGLELMPGGEIIKSGGRP